MGENNALRSPVNSGERIIVLDVLRGFAILGILVMNIQSFSMIGAAYMNPTAYGDLSGINFWISELSAVFANLKFMALFSMLFGAGLMLMSERIEAKGGRPAAFYYRRTFWLILMGLVHAYLFWYGDILFIYGICGLLIYLFRRRSPRTLLIVAILFLAVPFMLNLLFGWSMKYWPPEAMEGLTQGWAPSMEKIQTELDAYRGGVLDQLPFRALQSITFHTFLMVIWFFWRVSGLMLLGMALYKWGVLSGKRSKAFYWKLALIGLGLGIPLVSYGQMKLHAAGWEAGYSMFIGSQYNYWGSLPVALGYIGVVALFCLSRFFPGLKNNLAAVGRMALTNYLIQTLLCTTLFYGHGFGLYGKLERWEQVLVVLAVWIFQLAVSPIWLRYFRFGPFEWLWRSLTYWRMQPM